MIRVTLLESLGVLVQVTQILVRFVVSHAGGIKATAAAVAAVRAARNCYNVITVAGQHLFSEGNSQFFLRCVIIANVL